MTHPSPTVRPRRVLAGLLSAALPAALLAVATPPASAGTTAGATFTWKVSQQFVDHFSPAAWNQSTLEASDGATLTDDQETVFTEGTGDLDPATGEGTASYTGTVTGTFVVGAPQYSVSISDPEVSVEDGKGEIRADVAWTVPVEDQRGSTEDVLVTTFDATTGNWSGRTLSATPHFADVLPADSTRATALGLPADQPLGGRSFAPEFLESLGEGVRAHFYASGGGGDAKKAPAPFAAAVPETQTETPEPKATATITQADAKGLKFNVKGTNYSGESPGLYIGLTEAGPIDATDADAYSGTAWVQPSSITDGSFDQDLALIGPDEIADLDPDADYEIHTQKAHGQSTQDPSQNARIPVDIDFSTWDDTEGPAGPETPEEPETPADTAISATDVETSYGKHTVVTAEVLGARGRVTLTLGGEKKSGWVKDDAVSFVVPRDLTARIHTARWSYPGNSDFAPSAVASTVIMRSAPTSAKSLLRRAADPQGRSRRPRPDQLRDHAPRTHRAGEVASLPR